MKPIKLRNLTKNTEIFHILYLSFNEIETELHSHRNGMLFILYYRLGKQDVNCLYP